MCGIAGAVGVDGAADQIQSLLAAMHHRGPDAQACTEDGDGRAALGAVRLRIVDLSPTADGVLATEDGRYHLAFNGEVYNHPELRSQLRGYRFRTTTDTEVVLAAWSRWGPACLDRLVGMFALLVWDTQEQRLHAARDRFGVKPLYLHQPAGGGVVVASEVAALLAGGVPAHPDEQTWSTYLTSGTHEGGGRTFWDGIAPLAPGHHLTWDAAAGMAVRPWYDLIGAVGPELDLRADDEVEAEVEALLAESVGLRFRADVPVGVALSSGLDSATLLELVHQVQGPASEVAAFTFVTGDPAYDEADAVHDLLARTRHPHHRCLLTPAQVPALALSVHRGQREPVGGLPTLAYARIFEEAQQLGVKVVLDGQGMDEAWAGYGYYAHAGRGPQQVVQGTATPITRPETLTPAFAALAAPPAESTGFGDPLRDLQLRDLLRTKLPRSLRYNDGVSMRASVELREPFLDHRLVELALRQPPSRTIGDGRGKALIRRITHGLLPDQQRVTAKRALQTPQREWLRGSLQTWADERIEAALAGPAGAWLDPAAVRREWARFSSGEGDNAFFVWQWVTLGLEEELVT
jgi:asparagine synthase (glutamine-hydrolysing)